jgi:hypothetical protein
MCSDDGRPKNFQEYLALREVLKKRQQEAQQKAEQDKPPPKKKKESQKKVLLESQTHSATPMENHTQTSPTPDSSASVHTGTSLSEPTGTSETAQAAQVTYTKPPHESQTTQQPTQPKTRRARTKISKQVSEALVGDIITSPTKKETSHSPLIEVVEEDTGVILPLSPDQQKVLEIVLSGKNVFFTGAFSNHSFQSITHAYLF